MPVRIEDQLFDFVVNEARNEGATTLIARYLPTKKNLPVESLFDHLGCELKHRGEHGNKTYEKDLTVSSSRGEFFATLIRRETEGLESGAQSDAAM